MSARALSVLTQEISTVLLILLVIACMVLSPDFMTRGNMQNLADQLPAYGILAVGQMLAIITGGIDLSVGSMLAIGAFFCASQSYHGLLAAIVAPIVVCGLIGMVDGLAIAFTRVPPFIITLAMLSIARGISLQAAAIYHGAASSGSGAEAVSVDSTSLVTQIDQKSILGLPLGLYIMVVVFLAVAYVLRYTSFGRHLYALGGNEAAALLLGVRVRRVKVILYTLTGMLSGLAGVVFAARLASAPPTAGQGYELISITAVVVGGALLTGGVGTMRGTAIGLLVVGILPNIFDLLRIGQDWQQVARGSVLLGVVLVQLLVLPMTRIGGIRVRAHE